MLFRAHIYCFRLHIKFMFSVHFLFPYFFPQDLGGEWLVLAYLHLNKIL